MVTLIDSSAAAHSFAENQCDLRSGGGLDEVVLIAGPRLMVSGNTVTHTTDATSMQLFTGRAGVAAPIGNITTAGIRLNGVGLPVPFDALNPNG